MLALSLSCKGWEYNKFTPHVVWSLTIFSAVYCLPCRIFVAMLFTGIISVVAMAHFGRNVSKTKNVHNLFVVQQPRTRKNVARKHTHLQACVCMHTHKSISDRLSNKQVVNLRTWVLNSVGKGRNKIYLNKELRY
jgi:ABC-type nickel/cobalt efflux system permease component RcnA